MPKLSPEPVKVHCIKIHDVDPVLNIAKWTQSHQDRLDILVTARSVSHCMWPSSKPKVAAAISVRLSKDLERPVREEEKAFLSFVCTERGWAASVILRPSRCTFHNESIPAGGESWLSTRLYTRPGCRVCT